MSKATTVKEVLLATRWIIDNVEWCQKVSYITNDGLPTDDVSVALDHGVQACCLAGASNLVDTDWDIGWPARDLIRSACGTKVISLWNDKPGRTKQEVLDLLDGIIAKLPSIINN
jgi:hypothetical protein